MIRFAKKLLLATSILGVGFGAQAQQVQLEWADIPVEARSGQVFHLEVSGPLLKDSDSGKKSNFEGVGFAISQKHLLTAKHVTRDDQPRGTLFSFAPIPNLRGLYVPDREITVVYDPDEGKENHPTDRNNVTVETSNRVVAIPATDQQVDTVLLEVQKLAQLPDPLPLSACPLTRGETYYVWKLFNLEGEEPLTSVDDIYSTPITFVGDSKYGILKEFQNIDPKENQFQIVQGDSGSPVLNDEGKVVGHLSAVSGNDVYVTLTSSFLDLIPSNIVVECAENRINPQEFKFLLDRVARLEGEFSKEEGKMGRVTQAEAGLESLGAKLTEEAKRLTETIATAQTAADNATTIGNNAQTAANNAQASANNAQQSADLANSSANTALNALDDLPEDKDAIKEFLEKFKSADLKVLPTLQTINEDLTEPVWSYDAQKMEDREGIRFLGTYTRPVRSTDFDNQKKYCLTPIHPVFGVDEDLYGPAADPRQSRHYRMLDALSRDRKKDGKSFDRMARAYEDIIDALEDLKDDAEDEDAIEEMIKSAEPADNYCHEPFVSGVNDDDKGLSLYTYEAKLDTKYRDFKETFSDWDGLYYLQVLTNPFLNNLSSEPKEDGDQKEAWEIEKVYVIQLSDDQIPTCFDIEKFLKADQGKGDAVAEFVGDFLEAKENGETYFDDELKQKLEC